MKTTKTFTALPGLKHIICYALISMAFLACDTLEEEAEIVITTDQVAYVREGCYEVSCRILDMGTEEIQEHGVCWSEYENPEVNNASFCLGSRSREGEFACTISGLTPETRYYFRSFAKLNALTVYGDEIVFTTYPRDVLTDINGNIYMTVEIGEQTWMAQNLKVTRYADGTEIPLVDNQPDWYDLTREDMAYCWYEDRSSNGFTHGGLYSWVATVRGLDVSDKNPSGIQGVCPDGWHVPSDSEWKELEMYLGMDIFQANSEGWRGEEVGGLLKQEGTKYWKEPNTGASNATGFNALASGYRHGSGFFHGQTTTTRFWTTSKKGYSYGWYRQLDADNSSIRRHHEGVYRGHSVRCIKDG